MIVVNEKIFVVQAKIIIEELIYIDYISNKQTL